jgi:hypothetical protein
MLKFEDSEDKPTVEFITQKSPFARVIKADGFWGQVTPMSDIQLHVYSQFHSMPDSVTHELIESADGVRIGPEVSRYERKGIIREVESTLIVPIHIAKSLVQLLQARIAEVEGVPVETPPTRGGY